MKLFELLKFLRIAELAVRHEKLLYDTVIDVVVNNSGTLFTVVTTRSEQRKVLFLAPSVCGFFGCV